MLLIIASYNTEMETVKQKRNETGSHTHNIDSDCWGWNTQALASSTYVPQPLENTPIPHFRWTKGHHLLLKSTPTQQTKICSNMHSDEKLVYMYVWASGWSGCKRGADESVWPRKTSARQRHYHTRHVRIGVAHIGEQRAVAGAGETKEQIESEWSERATYRSYYSCCRVLLLYCSLLL